MSVYISREHGTHLMIRNASLSESRIVSPGIVVEPAVCVAGLFSVAGYIRLDWSVP